MGTAKATHAASSTSPKMTAPQRLPVGENDGWPMPMHPFQKDVHRKAAKNAKVREDGSSCPTPLPFPRREGGVPHWGLAGVRSAAPLHAFVALDGRRKLRHDHIEVADD